MSARRSGQARAARRARAARVVANLAGLDGMPGGCPDCRSTAEMRRDPKNPGVLVVNVRHNDGCPWFRAYEARHGR